MIFIFLNYSYDGTNQNSLCVFMNNKRWDKYLHTGHTKICIASWPLVLHLKGHDIVSCVTEKSLVTRISVVSFSDFFLHTSRQEHLFIVSILIS